METKLFEIRDIGTFIPALGIRIGGSDGYLARRAGFGEPCVYLIHLEGERCAYDSYAWNSRTMSVAHQYIEENWQRLQSGALVDVQFILLETTEPKTTEEMIDPLPEENKPTFRDSNAAFQQAIEEGRLSDNAISPLYAGHYMYMGTYDGVDTFKNIVTREYLPVRQEAKGA